MSAAASIATCTHCGDVFPTRSSRDRHTKQCPLTVYIQVENGIIGLKAISKGQFQCACAGQDCPEIFQRRSDLIEHLSLGSHWLGAWVNPQTVEGPIQQLVAKAASSTVNTPPAVVGNVLGSAGSGTGDGGQHASSEVITRTAVNEASMLAFIEDRDLVHTEWLTSIGLCYQKTLSILCCMVCKVALTKDQVQGHLSEHHKLITLDSEQLDEECKALRVTGQFCDLGTEDSVPAIGGLSLHRGYGCPLCLKASASTESLRVHYHTSHCDAIPRPKEWCACYMQRLSNVPPHHRWFRVSLPTALPIQLGSSGGASVPSSSLPDFVQEMGKLSTVIVEPRDAREISPWLLNTQWHVHTGPYSASQLRQLVTGPSPNDFPSLASLVEEYYMAAVSLVKETDLLVLQHLNSDDPVKQ
ncbi:hypothetical protein DAEQUDRAFT_770796 [Daedalea quercina L-15889]|uniref:C2H2-type domain-containing protein n=1 Tax=Daedalea quercina L-15889 TaxID=1314783 RepID=A0A165KJT9_9APHY|nr:hypothetical protein DAEQUDRAFT_770796 [Daedalea quercina L-15889]